MRRIVVIIGFAVALSASVGLAGSAAAQTGDAAGFCAARLEANGAEGKAANLAVMAKLVNAAPASVAQPMTALRDAYKKKGDKVFETDSGLALLSQLDAWVYDNCPGTQVPVTATDYQFSGVPASLPAGVAKFKLTNSAPKENHEMVLFKLNDKGVATDPEKIIAMSQGKAQKLIDHSTQAFMFAAPGTSGYSPIELTPGKYLYACFVAQAGKKHGEMHAKLGMYGTFAVS